MKTKQKPRLRIRVFERKIHYSNDLRLNNRTWPIKEHEDFIGSVKQCQRFVSRVLAQKVAKPTNLDTRFEIICYPPIKEPAEEDYQS